MVVVSQQQQQFVYKVEWVFIVIMKADWHSCLIESDAQVGVCVWEKEGDAAMLWGKVVVALFIVLLLPSGFPGSLFILLEGVAASLVAGHQVFLSLSPPLHLLHLCCYVAFSILFSSPFLNQRLWGCDSFICWCEKKRMVYRFVWICFVVFCLFVCFSLFEFLSFYLAAYIPKKDVKVD